MKKLVLLLFSILLVSNISYAKSYKVNTHGKVTSPNGVVQQNSKTPNSTVNYYHNHSANNYIQSAQVNNNQTTYIEIVMDYSGSMSSWISEAKSAMTQILSQIPNSTLIGLRVFGHDGGQNPYDKLNATVNGIKASSNGKYVVKASKNKYHTCANYPGCDATTQIVPVIPKNPSYLISQMNTVDVGGATPLTLALSQAIFRDLGNIPQTKPKKIVLITDGGETCNGDPCALARELMSKRKDIHIDVVLLSSNSRALMCLSNITGGNFYTTNDLSSFSTVLANSLKSSPTAKSQPQPTTINRPVQEQKYEYIPF